jgi:hypothetical protein
MKKFANGTYNVKITDITTGESSRKGTPYLELTYSNGFRYIKDRIHTANNGYKYLSLVFWKAGLDLARNSIDELIGRRIGIEVVSGSYVSQYGEYRTFGQLGTIYSIDELNLRQNDYQEITREPDFEENESCSAGGASMEDVFGIDIDDIASDMGKDPGDISDSDIREYCGY